MKPRLCYLVCATRRTGTNLLCHGLEDTKIAGYPGEYFEFHMRTRWGVLGIREYINRLLDESKTQNEVFGASIMWDRFQEITEELKMYPQYKGITTRKLMADLFPNLKYVYLTRNDKVQQAVSFVKARQTNEWKKMVDGTVGKNPLRKTSKKNKYDFMQIHHFVNELTAHDNRWKQFFYENKIKAYTIVYEEFIKNYEETIRGVISYLKITEAKQLTIPKSRLVKQFDSISDDWIRKYHKLEFFLKFRSCLIKLLKKVLCYKNR